MKNWTSVFTTTEEYRAEEVRVFLEAEGIPVVILSRKDSAYVLIGEIEVMVNAGDVERAGRVIKEIKGE